MNSIFERNQPAVSEAYSAESRARPGSGVHRALRIYYTYKFGNLFLGFFFQIFVAKALRPDNYATYAILLAIIMVAERLLSFGLDRTVMRFVPPLTLQGDFRALRWLFARLAIIRVLSVATMIFAIFLTAAKISNSLPSPISIQTTYALAAWFVSYSLLSDADAIFQSWMAHVDIALAATLELLARCAVISLTAACGYMIDLDVVVTVSALTSAGSLLILFSRLVALRDKIRHFSTSANRNSYPTIDVREAPTFALAAYASTLGWLTTSPGAIRIVAKSGLDVVALASFSFIQGLCISLQRGLPGLLVLPSLEPLMARLGAAAQRERMFATMSFVFKIELVCILAIIVVTSIAGSELVALLSRAEYAHYFYVMPALMIVIILQTIYRICEIILSMRLEHRFFIRLWPLALLSIATIYFTVGRFGLLSVLFGLIGEGITRIAIILIAHRRVQIWRALDPIRSLQIVFSALVVMLVVFVARVWGVPVPSDIAAAALGLLAFLGSLFLIRPLYGLEVDIFIGTLPSSLDIIKRFARLLARS